MMDLEETEFHPENVLSLGTTWLAEGRSNQGYPHTLPAGPSMV